MTKPETTLPPCDKTAERAVIGAALRFPDVLDELVPILRAQHFYADCHQRIYRALVDLRDGGKTIDLVTLANELNRRRQIEDIGGPAYLGELWADAPSSAGIRHHAEIVVTTAKLRALINAGSKLVRDAFCPGADPDAILAGLDSELLAIGEAQQQESTVKIRDCLRETFERIEERGQGKIRGIPTGFTELDNETGGLHDGELAVIAARPSVGKTSLALGIARHAAAVEGCPTLFISLEQSRLELTERLLCGQGEVNSHDVRSGCLRAEDSRRLMHAGAFFRESGLFINDRPTQRVADIAANARRLKRREGLRLVIVDYLQLIEPENVRAQRHEQVGQMSRRLKLLARELQIPVVLLAQLNRKSEDRKDLRPRCSDLRESGAVEQDSDAVYLLHKVDAKAEERNPGEVDVIIGKQRNGPTGTVALRYNGEFMRFEDLDTRPAFGSTNGAARR